MVFGAIGTWNGGARLTLGGQLETQSVAMLLRTSDIPERVETQSPGTY